MRRRSFLPNKPDTADFRPSLSESPVRTLVVIGTCRLMELPKVGIEFAVGTTSFEARRSPALPTTDSWPLSSNSRALLLRNYADRFSDLEAGGANTSSRTSPYHFEPESVLALSRNGASFNERTRSPLSTGPVDVHSTTAHHRGSLAGKRGWASRCSQRRTVATVGALRHAWNTRPWNHAFTASGS